MSIPTADGCGTPKTTETSKTELSKPAEILYRAFFDELRFAKQQQWTITNYLVLTMAAVYGIAKIVSKSPTFSEKVLWCVFLAIIGSVGLFLLFDLQDYIRRTRTRQKDMEKTFSAEDQRLAQGKPPTQGEPSAESAGAGGFVNMFVSLLCKIEPFLLVLCTAITAAAIVCGLAIVMG
jgi:hypothetical protein